MTSRLKTDYKGIGDLPTLMAEDLLSIELKAKAMTLPECLEFLFLTEDELTEEEARFAKLAYRKGRAAGISTAADNLFASMKMRGGGPVALEYLRQLSGTFTLEATPEAGTKSGFNFNVVMPETK
jgi:hypothetical protein